MRVRVAGELGFIESHLVGSVLQRRETEDCIALDNPSTGSKDNRAHADDPPRRTVIADISAPAAHQLPA